MVIVTKVFQVEFEGYFRDFKLKIDVADFTEYQEGVYVSSKCI